MKKLSSSFVCQECGYDSPKYLGKCPECGMWNSFKEFKTQSGKSSPRNGIAASSHATPIPLTSVASTQAMRSASGFSEMDGVLGGGIVKGSVVLVAGDPGVGKSTLLLQVAVNFATKDGGIVLYVCGEESAEQVKLRAERLSKSRALSNIHLLATTDTDVIAQVIGETKPALVIIDSIQTMASENVGGLAGALAQIRYATSVFIRAAKTLSIPLILVGHVTKEGMVAGPMLLSHMVDVVLFLEGEKNTGTRILRSLKNRFGPVDEVGIFALSEGGMEEVQNPQSLFLSQSKDAVPGSISVVTLEGTRAFLVELQALAVTSKLPLPRRVAIGIDPKRLELLLAVLQKHAHLPLATMDVFVNVAGGLKLSDPAIDLGICLALYSSFKNKALGKTVGIAEVGLLGELRSVQNLPKRIKEAEKLGYTTILSAQTHKTLSQALHEL